MTRWRNMLESMYARSEIPEIPEMASPHPSEPYFGENGDFGTPVYKKSDSLDALLEAAARAVDPCLVRDPAEVWLRGEVAG